MNPIKSISRLLGSKAKATKRAYVPRYIRRHAVALAIHRTRRQRRHRAVILRIAAQKGIRL